MATPHNWRIVDADVAYLKSKGFAVEVAADRSWVVVLNLSLPPGRWTVSGTPTRQSAVWLPVPHAFPFEVPGAAYDLAHAIHVQPLYVNGRQLVDTHDSVHGPHWRWLCFTEIDLDPATPRPLVALLQIVEASLTDRMGRT